MILSRNLDTQTNALANKIKPSKIEHYSSSIKFCKIAEGNADIYPRLKSISKWI